MSSHDVTGVTCPACNTEELLVQPVDLSLTATHVNTETGLLELWAVQRATCPDENCQHVQFLDLGHDMSQLMDGDVTEENWPLPRRHGWIEYVPYVAP
jgi:hypothetical protein